MRCFPRRGLPLAAALLSLSCAAHAVTIPNVYNTGLGIGGAALTPGGGQSDAHYVVVSSTAPGVIVGSSAQTYYSPAYLQDGPESRVVNAFGIVPGTACTTTAFATSFSMAGWDPTSATLSGMVLFDNMGKISLNGHLIGSVFNGQNTLVSFGANSDFFDAGLNTLTFVVHNHRGGPQAFQVAGLTVNAAAVPEPATWAMTIGGFVITGAALRRRSPMFVVTG